MSEQEQMRLLQRRQSQVEQVVVEILLNQEKAEKRMAALEQRVDDTDTMLRKLRDVLREKLLLFKECEDEQQEVALVKATLQLMLDLHDSLPG